MELIVTCRELQYAGKTYLTGARFEATDKDAKLLKAINKAADAPAPTKPLREVASVAPPAPTEAKAEPDPEPAPELDPAEPQLDTPDAAAKPYRTRRLKAEE